MSFADLGRVHDVEHPIPHLQRELFRVALVVPNRVLGQARDSRQIGLAPVPFEAHLLQESNELDEWLVHRLVLGHGAADFTPFRDQGNASLPPTSNRPTGL